jgi:hypothetical protein
MRCKVEVILLAFLSSAFAAVGQVNCPPHLPLTLVGNTSYCVGSPGSALHIAQNYVGYEWLPTSETDQNVLLTAGNYAVVVTHYTGCTDTLEFQVQQVSNPPQPVIDVSGPTQFCEGESVVLSVPVTYPYYEWNTGSVSHEITVFGSGTYVVAISDWIGCVSSSNSVQITVDPLPTAAFSPDLDLFHIEFNNLSFDATDYEWNFGDGVFSNDFEPTHSYSVSGTLEMWLVASNDCGSDTAFLSLTSVAVDEEKEQEGLAIYPNPTNVNFSVDLGLGNNNGDVSIYNSLGERVASQAIDQNDGVVRFQTEGFASGIYWVQTVLDGKTHTGRLVVLH